MPKLHLLLYIVNQKLSPAYFSNNSVKNQPICITIGIRIVGDIYNSKIVAFPTSSE